MTTVSYLLLRFLHVIHSFLILVPSLWKRFTSRPPLPLMAPRRRIPKHLAILFVTGAGVDPETVEDRVLDSLDSLIVWCRAIGIEKLSLYDSDGTSRLQST